MMMKMIAAMCVTCMPWGNYAENITENRLGAERALAVDSPSKCFARSSSPAGTDCNKDTPQTCEVWNHVANNAGLCEWRGFVPTHSECLSACRDAGSDANVKYCTPKCEAFGGICWKAGNPTGNTQAECTGSVGNWKECPTIADATKHVGQQILQWLREAIVNKNQFKACINHAHEYPDKFVKNADGKFMGGDGAPAKCKEIFKGMVNNNKILCSTNACKPQHWPANAASPATCDATTDPHYCNYEIYTDAYEGVTLANWNYATAFTSASKATCTSIVKDQKDQAAALAICQELGNCAKQILGTQTEVQGGNACQVNADCYGTNKKCNQTKKQCEIGENAAKLLRMLQRSQNKKNEFRRCLLDKVFELKTGAANTCKDFICEYDGDCEGAGETCQVATGPTSSTCVAR